MTKSHDEPYSDPDTWMVAAPRKDGTWWPEWIAWLEEQSSEPAAPLAIGAAEKGYLPLADALGLFFRFARMRLGFLAQSSLPLSQKHLPQARWRSATTCAGSALSNPDDIRACGALPKKRRPYQVDRSFKIQNISSDYRAPPEAGAR